MKRLTLKSAVEKERTHHRTGRVGDGRRASIQNPSLLRFARFPIWDMDAEDFDSHEKGASQDTNSREKDASDVNRLVQPPGFTQKRKRPAPKTKEYFSQVPGLTLIKRALPIYMVFECASGYALFLPSSDVDEVGWDFESTEEYIKRYNQVFKLIAFCPFESPADALCQIHALSNSTMTEQLKHFLLHNLPKLNLHDLNYSLVFSDCLLASNVLRATKIAFQSSVKLSSVMRGLRSNICKFINLKPGDLEKAQRDLALRYSRQRCNYAKYKGNSMAAKSSISSFNDEVVVVPHRIEGVYIAKGKNDYAICTKNLVPGEAVYGEDLISVKNEDGTETEYREWNPLRSKLAAAILSGLSNIWVKPGSRVLYMGDVCGTTVSHLSDLVGPDGLVYALGLSDAVVYMAEKRSNVVAIYGDYPGPWKYRIFLSMVDVICADPTSLSKLNAVVVHAVHYLRAGGHYLISTQADYVVSNGQGEATFARLSRRRQMEFKLFEVIKLGKLHKDLVMVPGGFRMLD